MSRVNLSGNPLQVSSKSRTWALHLFGTRIGEMVEVGQNAIVTSGSVANKSLPPEGIYGGNATKLARRRWWGDT